MDLMSPVAPLPWVLMSRKGKRRAAVGVGGTRDLGNQLLVNESASTRGLP